MSITGLNFVLDANGLQIPTLSDFAAWLKANKRSLYGADVDLSSSSPDGQEININAQAYADISELLMQIYTSMSKSQAVGKVLDQRVTNIERLPGAYSQEWHDVVVSKSLTLYGMDQTAEDIFTYADNSGTKWQLVTTQTLTTPGTYSLLFQCKTIGRIIPALNSVNVPATIILGVTSVNNPSAPSLVGTDEESDVAFKIRDAKSTSAKSGGFNDQILAALSNLPGMVSANPMENPLDTVDDRGVPAHGYWIITDGEATDKDIATSIYSNRTGGSNMRGVKFYDIPEKNGGIFRVYWDEVTMQPLYIYIVCGSIDGVNSPNIPLILENLPSLFAPTVGETVDVGQLVTYVKQIDPNTLLSFTTENGCGLNSSDTFPFYTTQKPDDQTRQFQVTSANIYILPSVLMPKSVSVTKSSTQQFVPYGGTQSGWVYSIPTNHSGATIDANGLYTAGSVSGTDTVQAKDSPDGNLCISTVYVQ